MMHALDDEISGLLKETAEALTEEYYFKFCDVLRRLGLSEGVPVEIWMGLANAVANISGYRVVLQVAIVEPIEGEPDTCRTVGQREIASAEPILWIETVRE